jgi:lipoprotein-anchoring transpeptidase ErfK/SrfK
MKLLAFLAASALALVTSQATAQDLGQDLSQAPVKHAAAPALHNPDTTAPRSEPKPADAPAPEAKPSADPAAAGQPPKAAPRAVRRAPPQQQQQSQGFWSNFGRGNSTAGQADPRYARPQQPSRQSYSARPAGNRLFLGMFYSTIPRQTVAFRENYAPGTIIVRQRERRLYYVLGNGQVLQYAVAVGREGAAWAGTSVVSNKREWPTWTPTPEILRRQPNLPRFMEGGPQNPMGARALYLGDTLYRIHGTNEPWMIGEEASSGCIRMTNDDVIDLYNRTRMGATVIVQR